MINLLLPLGGPKRINIYDVKQGDVFYIEKVQNSLYYAVKSAELEELRYVRLSDGVLLPIDSFLNVDSQTLSYHYKFKTKFRDKSKRLIKVGLKVDINYE